MRGKRPTLHYEDFVIYAFFPSFEIFTEVKIHNMTFGVMVTNVSEVSATSIFTVYSVQDVYVVTVSTGEMLATNVPMAGKHGTREVSCSLQQNTARAQ
jgi:hypothetical protein